MFNGPLNPTKAYGSVLSAIRQWKASLDLIKERLRSGTALGLPVLLSTLVRRGALGRIQDGTMSVRMLVDTRSSWTRAVQFDYLFPFPPNPL